MGRNKKILKVEEKNEVKNEIENSDNECNKDDKTTELTTEQKSENISRPRGRPKKTISQQNTTQKKIKLFEIDNNNQKESVTLQIPLYDDSSSELSDKNQFTMKDDSDDEIVDKDNDSKNQNNCIMYLSDDDNNYDDYRLKSLEKKLKKKEEIIKKLKDEMNNKSDGYNDSCYSLSKNKVQNVNILNMKIFPLNKDNKLVIGEKTKIACWWCTYNFDDLLLYS
jgi:hypothetical protein